jgi:hypothetical protein
VGLAAVVLVFIVPYLGLHMPVDRKTWPAFFIIGFLNNVIPFSLTFWGQTHIASGLASILNATTPVSTVIVAHFLTRDEKLTANRLVGVLIGLTGVSAIIGPTGVGKTYLACALAHKACREGYAALYFRLPRLLQELALARGDGRYVSLLKTIARADLLVLDDWGLKGFAAEQQHDLLEILEDRHGLRSTLITSQLPTDHWHELITNATVADAICDRLVHNAYRITLKGESMRKTKIRLT